MIQFEVLSGKQAGTISVARHFPFGIGRSPAMDLRLDEDGVWDQHLELRLLPESGFVLSRQADAIAFVNGASFEHLTLRNGDLIELGSVKLRFWLAETCQYSLRAREFLTWLILGILCLAQVALIYWLK